MKTLIYILALFSISSVGFAQDASYKINMMLYGGLPETNMEHKILYNFAFISAYSEEMKNPLWVAYRLGNQRTTRNFDHRNDDHQHENDHHKWARPPRFIVDARTTAKVSHEDYMEEDADGIKYQRGHMAPNATMLSQYGHMAQFETYLMTNIIPQREELNENLWADLEAEIRNKVSQDDTNNKQINQVFVVTGPIFDDDNPKTIGNGVKVPSRCFKILAYRRGYFGDVLAVAFIMPQNPTKSSIWDYVATVREVEQATGINFHPNLSDEDQDEIELVKRDFKFNER